MSSLDRGEKNGYVIGSVAVPLLLAWLIVLVYERVKKRKVKRRVLVIVIIGIIIYALAAAGRLGRG